MSQSNDNTISANAQLDDVHEHKSVGIDPLCESQSCTEQKETVVFKVPFTAPAHKLSKQVKGASSADNHASIPSDVNSNLEDRVDGDGSVPQIKPSSNVCDTVTENRNFQKPPADISDTNSAAIPYEVPEWSGMPSKSYSFEVLKGGVILETISLSSRPLTICGRLPSCDIAMDHPSISRHHAIIQYRAQAEKDKGVGFYLYDLESTHGTQLNKCPVRPRSYYRLHVGHMLKFGGSSRTYILQGPPDDEEEESELTVTEIKERKKQEEEHMLRLQEQAKAKVEKEDEDEGIDWGMGEDATEEDNYSENPFALSAQPLNEELYIEDPKKTLRGWFEREGYELEYAVEEKGPAHFLCRIELPLDTPSGGTMYAEASVKGKKKEAVVACALEACRILDRHGVLRKAHTESRKRKKRNWEENDFYDSDEDTYLDQTGTIERKRLQRIQRSGKDSSKAETYESLLEKYNKVLKEIEDIEELLKKQRDQVAKQDAEETDSLDAYMLTIRNITTLDKKEITRLKIHLSQLKSEERKLQKLVNITKPAMLPYITKSSFLKPLTNIEQPIIENPLATTESTSSLDDSDNFDKTLESPIEPCASPKSDIQSPTLTEKVDVVVDICKDDESEKTSKDADAIRNSNVGVNKPQSCNDSPEKGTFGALQAIIKDDSKNSRKLKQKKYDYDSSDPNYAMWLPPDDQSGDGRTKLNEKYGY